MKIWPMFCKACGQGIDRGDRFCRNCGVPLPQEPIESAVAATAAATKTSELPIGVASSTAALQRPLPIPKALLTEVASAAAVEEKPAAAVTVPAIPDAAPAATNADKTSSNGQPREAAQPAAPQPKVEAADVAAQKATEPTAAVDVAPPKPAEPKPKATETPAQAAPEKQPQSSAQPAPSSVVPVVPEPEKKPQASEVRAEKPSAVAALDLRSTDAPKAQAEQPAVSVQQAQAVSTSAATMPETTKPDEAGRVAEPRPLRLCPHCHRIVGEDEVVCGRCKAKLDQPAVASAPTQAAPDLVSEQHYGVPSFAGYAAEPPKKDAEKSSASVAVADPSGIDALANLRVRKRRGLSVLEIVVVVVLLAGAGVAVWMLRSSLPNKTSTPAVSVAITISPTRAKVAAGHGYDFAATVAGTDNYNVDWAVEEGDNGGRIVPRGAKAKSGAVSSLAVYMAPKTPGTYHLTATSKADPAKSASAIITVTGK